MGEPREQMRQSHVESQTELDYALGLSARSSDTGHGYPVGPA